MSARSTWIWGAALAALATGVSPGAALAQETEARADEDVIVVTARKRKEVLQDVPIAVSAFDADALQDRGIFSTADLTAFTPGFQQNQAFGRDGDRPVIRGASNILIGEGKVGIFLDGVPVVGDSSGTDLRSLQRVEVIRGPQAAVFGRGTLSGAINYVSRRPSDEPELTMEASFGSYDRIESYVSVLGRIPLIEGLGGFLSFRTYDFGGDYDNTVTGGRLGAEHSETLNAALFYDPTPDLSVTVRYIDTEDDDGHFAVALLPASANNCFLTTRAYFCGEVPAPTSYGINTDDILRPGLLRETERLQWQGDWDIMGSGFMLSYQGSVTDQHEISGYDQSYDSRTFFLPFPPVFGPVGCTSTSFLQQQNRLCGASPFNDTSGFFQVARTHELRLSTPDQHAVRFSVGYFDLNVVRKPDFSVVEFTNIGPDGAFAGSAGTRDETSSWAAFAGAEWDATDRLTLTAELRYQEDEITTQELQYRVGDLFPVLPADLRNPNPNQIVGSTARRSTTFDATLPRLTATYELSDAVTLYAQYAVGNSPGGFNSLNAPETEFEEEQLTNYEVGLKSSLFGFDYLNVTAFFNQYDDQVLTATFSTPTVSSYRANIGEVETYGIEIEAQRELIEGLTATFTYSYLDSEFVSGFEAQQALFVGGGYCAVGSNPDLSLVTPAVTVGGVPANTACLDLASVVGKSTPLVSPHTAALGLRYERLVADGMMFFVGGDLTYRDSFYSQVDNLNETGAATRLGAQIGIENDIMRLAFWGRNITDDDTPEGILRYVDFPAPRPTLLPAGPGFNGTPRAFAITPTRREAYGVTLTFSF